MEYLIFICILQGIMTTSIVPQTTDRVVLRNLLINGYETTTEYEITYTGIEFVYKNHVGNEWYYYVKINGSELQRGDRIDLSLNPNSQITIDCYLFEDDPSYTDQASERVNLGESNLNEYSGSGFYIPVTIQEGHGRYRGNTAQVKFNFRVRVQ